MIRIYMTDGMYSPEYTDVNVKGFTNLPVQLQCTPTENASYFKFNIKTRFKHRNARVQGDSHLIK